MIGIKLLPAEYGDCILVTVENEKPFNILIDGGTKCSYKSSLKPLINEIINKGQKINLVVCTHIDYDHISGLIEMVNDNEIDTCCIDEIWYNGFLQVVNNKYFSQKENKLSDRDNEILMKIIEKGMQPSDEQDIGINDGMALGTLIQHKGIALNKVSRERAISTNTINESIEVYPDTFVTIVGPSKKDLEALETVWKKDIIARNYNFRVSNKIKLTEAFEYQMAAIQMFYANERVKINESNSLEKYMSELLEDDESKTNASSISFILTHRKKKYLFLGDTVIDDDIMENIKNAVGERYHFNAIKLPHHGSRYNITNEFIKRYGADEYYCLTNSKRFDHPDIEVIANIIGNHPDLYKKMIFTYPIDKAIFFDREEWKKRYRYDVIMGCGNTFVERIFEDE